jgi:hypothetical protein
VKCCASTTVSTSKPAARLRVLRLHDGLYVAGEGMLCAVANLMGWLLFASILLGAEKSFARNYVLFVLRQRAGIFSKMGTGVINRELLF